MATLVPPETAVNLPWKLICRGTPTAALASGVTLKPKTTTTCKNNKDQRRGFSRRVGKAMNFWLGPADMLNCVLILEESLAKFWLRAPVMLLKRLKLHLKSAVRSFLAVYVVFFLFLSDFLEKKVCSSRLNLNQL